MPFAEGTTVPVDRSRAEIEKLLRTRGATSFASAWDGDVATIVFVLRGRRIRFRVNAPTREQAKKHVTFRSRRSTDQQITAWLEGEERRRWRALLLILRAKLEAIESGDVTLDEEFLANIVGPNDLTVYEVIRRMEAEGAQPLLGPLTDAK